MCDWGYAVSTAGHTACPPRAFPSTALELEKRESVCMPYMRRVRRLGVALQRPIRVCSERKSCAHFSVGNEAGDAKNCDIQFFFLEKKFFSLKRSQREATV